jgi:hypothetical protein
LLRTFFMISHHGDEGTALIRHSDVAYGRRKLVAHGPMYVSHVVNASAHAVEMVANFVNIVPGDVNACLPLMYSIPAAL